MDAEGNAGDGGDEEDEAANPGDQREQTKDAEEAGHEAACSRSLLCGCAFAGERAEEDGVQCVLLRGVLFFADFLLQAIGFEGEELFFQCVLQC